MKKRILIVSISLISSLIILLGVTYALVYQSYTFDNTAEVNTGNLNLDMAYENKFTLNNIPLTDSDAITTLNQYPVTLKNTGNIAYKYNLKLLSAVSNNVIKLDYVKIQVIVNEEDILCKTLVNGNYLKCNNETLNSDKIYPTLKELENTIIANRVLLANEEEKVNLRLWLSIDTPNTEIGKNFSGKLVLDAISTFVSTNAVN